MAINDIKTQSVGSTLAARAPKTTPTSEKKAAPSTTQTSGEGGVTVSLTSVASGLNQTAKGLAEKAPVNGQHVEALRTAIKEGVYKFNAERIADGLLRRERLMNGRG